MAQFKKANAEIKKGKEWPYRKKLPISAAVWLLGLYRVYIEPGFIPWWRCYVVLLICVVFTLVCGIWDHKQEGDIGEKGIASVLVAIVCCILMAIRIYFLTKWNLLGDF